MTLTLADIERWDPAAIRMVFDAAIRRAHGTRTASAAITESMRLLAFGGDTADAARAAVQHTALMLDNHADACDAVARAAEQSAEEIAAIKWRLGVLRGTARDSHLVIDEVAGAALPPANLSALSPGDQQGVFAAAVRVTEDLVRLLADAQTADEDLAAAIRGADGDLTAERVDAQLGHAPSILPALPDAGSTPEQVSRWWHALTPAQQDRVKQRLPDAIRNLDGIPATIRNQLNVAVLQRDLAHFEHGWYDRDGLWRTDPDKLADLQALRRTLQTAPGTQLILLDTSGDPRKVLASVGVGDVDNAACVGVMAGGLGTRVSRSAEDMVQQAAGLSSKARELRAAANRPNPDAVAAVVWLGYDAPDSLRDVINDWSARDAADRLNRFYHGLAASNSVPGGPQLTAFGHSYGSLVTSLALQQGAPVDDVVLYGSPGTELGDASQLGVRPGHAYYMIGINDVVAEVLSKFGAFGPAPQDVPGMTPLSTGTGLAMGETYGDGQLHERAYGHSDYARVGSNGQLRMSAYNMAAVLAGLPDDLIRPGAPVPGKVPGGSAPWELPPPVPLHPS